MLAIASLPVADLRSFVRGKTHRLAKPTFPTARVKSDFVRNTGSARERRRGGSPDVGGEDTFCDAKNALRFLTGGRFVHRQGRGRTARCVFRRLYHTGFDALRFDIGLVLDGFVGASAAEVAQFVASVPVRIETAGRDAMTLGQASAALANHYLVSSTALRRGNPRRLEPWWCLPVDGLLVLEAESGKLQPTRGTSGTVLSMDGTGIDLHYQQLDDRQLHGDLRRLWVVESTVRADRRRVRQVRMHLTRVHTESLCFRKTVNEAQSGELQKDLDVASGRLESHLRDVSRVLDKTERYGTPQRAILDLALQISSMVRPGALRSLLQAADNLRSNLQGRRKAMERREMQGWEKKMVFFLVAAVVLTSLYLVVRNKPFADPNLVVVLRVLLSVATGVLGAFIPGYFGLEWKSIPGASIRAGGALGFAALTFLYTPTVLPSLGTPTQSETPAPPETDNASGHLWLPVSRSPAAIALTRDTHRNATAASRQPS